MYPSKTAPERTADFIVHAVSLAGFALASGILISRAASLDNTAVLTAVVIYALSAAFSIGISFAYHLLPRHDLRPTLRRWDHAAIYVVIAGVFGPLLTVCGTVSAYAILALMWVFAAIGVVFKLAGGNQDSKWSLMSYLGMGWFALVALPDFWTGLPGASTALIGAGGLAYTLGTMVYRKKDLTYRYPIWHAFGTLGGTCFFVSIWMAVLS